MYVCVCAFVPAQVSVCGYVIISVNGMINRSNPTDEANNPMAGNTQKITECKVEY